MTKQEAIRIIKNNKDKSTDELKKILEDSMTEEQRKKFTSEHLFQLIIETNKNDGKRDIEKDTDHEIQKIINNKRKTEGRER